MTSVREVSLKAHEARESERAEKRRLDFERRAEEEAEKDAEAIKSIVLRSPLARWFPDVDWVIVARGTARGVVVRAADEPRPLFHLTGNGLTAGGEPIFRITIVELSSGGTWARLANIDEPADIGAFLARAEHAEVMVASDE